MFILTFGGTGATEEDRESCGTIQKNKKNTCLEVSTGEQVEQVTGDGVMTGCEGRTSSEGSAGQGDVQDFVKHTIV